MKWPTMDEFAKSVAEKAVDEVEFNGKTIRQWIEIIAATELGTNLAEVGTNCISREQAIDALCKLREEDIEDYGCEIPEGFNQDHLDRATFAIKQLPPIHPEIVRCKDCDWWTKQENSSQGRCALLSIYPTGGWFCGNAERRTE